MPVTCWRHGRKSPAQGRVWMWGHWYSCLSLIPWTHMPCPGPIPLSPCCIHDQEHQSPAEFPGIMHPMCSPCSCWEEEPCWGPVSSSRDRGLCTIWAGWLHTEQSSVTGELLKTQPGGTEPPPTAVHRTMLTAQHSLPAPLHSSCVAVQGCARASHEAQCKAQHGRGAACPRQA